LAQFADVHVSSDEALNTVQTAFIATFRETQRKELKKLVQYCQNLNKKIPRFLLGGERVSFFPTSSFNTFGNLSLPDSASKIPLFGALESEFEHGEELLEALEEDVPLTEDMVKALKLPPKPQFKGLQPMRAKESTRAISMITKPLIANIRLRNQTTE